MDGSFRRRLLGGEVLFGSWIQAGHPTVAEILANAGFDWIAADCEHTDIDLGSFAAVARAAHGRGATILARVRENDVLAVRQALDVGAQGVIVPLVNSAEEAERAVRAAKFPPRGVRGYSFIRANNWGVDFDAYAREANDRIAVVVMIESRAGVERIDGIMGVDGVDGAFIGPYDMSGSYGIPGRTSDPVVQEACGRVLEGCRQAGKAAGIHVVIPDRGALRKAVSDGFRLVGVGMDTVYLDQASREALAVAREASA